MRTTFVVMVVLGAMVLCAGAAFAQYGGYGGYASSSMEQEKPFVRAKIGWFEPSESDLDGDLAFGVDYVAPYKQPYLLYLTVDRLHADNAAVESTDWAILVGANLKVKGGYYYGAGIGLSREELETVAGNTNDTSFAWEIGGGLKIGVNGFGEIKYRDGGKDGNTGVIIYLGTSY